MSGPLCGPEREEGLDQARRLRSDRRAEEALALLERLEADHPRFSRLHQERARCHLQRGDAPAALAALRRAVALNPALPAAWDMLQRIHQVRGEAGEAGVAAARLAALHRLPPRLVAAHSLHADGDLGPAEEATRDRLREDATDGRALRLLARIRIEQGAPAEAVTLLEDTLAQAPDDREARRDYALLLLRQREPERAQAQAERLLAGDPADRSALKACAAAAIALGDDARVAELCTVLLPNAEGAEAADLHLWRGGACKALGRREAAVADYHASLTARPDNGVAWFSLANLKTYAFGAAEIARMEAAEGRPGTLDADRVYLRFALGQAQESRGEPRTAWRWYAAANALQRTLAPHDPQAAPACAARIRATLGAQALAGLLSGGEPDPAPIFVLGLPRSGSTLVEQILASHPAVEGTHELARIGRYAAALCGEDAPGGLPLRPEALLALQPEARRALGARYLADTRIHRRLGRPRFVDKTPDNVWHVALICAILPGATIIDVRREPMACGFSLFKQLFGPGQQRYSYALDEIAQHYRAYLGVMEHWGAILPGRVLTVHYEDLVHELEAQVRRMLDHCGLPFDPACLDFHATARRVRTPSSEQVRRPIGREGLDQWRRHAAELQPLRDALGDALTRYRR